MKRLQQIYNAAPPIGKILMILALMVIIFFLFRIIKKALEPNEPNEDTIDKVGDDLNKEFKSGEKLNYSVSQYNTWADGLYQAMDGFGTDFDVFKNVFNNMQNKADVLQLVKTFGLRKRVYNYFVVAGDDLNLPQWMTEELSTGELQEINSGLQAKNINYSF